jgi:hypothetical protein
MADMDRRTLLRGAVGLAVGLAGCSGDDGERFQTQSPVEDTPTDRPTFEDPESGGDTEKVTVDLPEGTPDQQRFISTGEEWVGDEDGNAVLVATIKNRGDRKHTGRVLATVRIDGEEKTYSKTLTLEPEETQEVRFTLPVKKEDHLVGGKAYYVLRFEAATPAEGK